MAKMTANKLLEIFADQATISERKYFTFVLDENNKAMMHRFERDDINQWVVPLSQYKLDGYMGCMPRFKK